MVPYLTQFTEVSKCRVAPVERKVSSVGWKHAKHLLQMDSEFRVVGMEPAAFHSEKKDQITGEPCSRDHSKPRAPPNPWT